LAVVIALIKKMKKNENENVYFFNTKAFPESCKKKLEQQV
jgi:hypothetical protein